MPDLKLDPSTWDLDLSGSALHLTDDTTGETVAQAVAMRLQLFRGEWFLDNRLGIDYFGQVLIKAPSLSDIEAIMRQAILATPGVSAITSYSQTLDRAARSLAISTTIQATNGTSITINAQVP